MPDALLAALLLLPFYAATLATDRLPARWRALPLALLCAVSLAALCELTRYDQGRGQLLFLVGTVGAPLGAIFGGASWGTRRFYGWPDLGPHPSRLGLWCLSLLLGVMAGSQWRAADVRESQARGDALLERVQAWRTAHPGAAPASLEAIAPDAPSTRMGWLAPPAFALVAEPDGGLALSFPVATHVDMRRKLGGGGWEALRARPAAGPGGAR